MAQNHYQVSVSGTEYEIHQLMTAWELIRISSTTTARGERGNNAPDIGPVTILGVRHLLESLTEGIGILLDDEGNRDAKSHVREFMTAATQLMEMLDG